MFDFYPMYLVMGRQRCYQGGAFDVQNWDLPNNWDAATINRDGEVVLLGGRPATAPGMGTQAESGGQFAYFNRGSSGFILNANELVTLGLILYDIRRPNQIIFTDFNFNAGLTFLSNPQSSPAVFQLVGGVLNLGGSVTGAIFNVASPLNIVSPLETPINRAGLNINGQFVGSQDINIYTPTTVQVAIRNTNPGYQGTVNLLNRILRLESVNGPALRRLNIEGGRVETFNGPQFFDDATIRNNPRRPRLRKYKYNHWINDDHIRWNSRRQ